MSQPPLKFLIVKTSSLGDIIQAFGAVQYLRKYFPDATIDWIIEERFASIVSAHPMISATISFNIRSFKKSWYRGDFWRSLFHSFKELRKNIYDVVFDLQGNCKAGIVTLLSRGHRKVGFGIKSVREWPNILATNVRFNIPQSINIRMQYVFLVQQYIEKDPKMKSLPCHNKIDCLELFSKGVRFKLTSEQSEQQEKMLSQLNRKKRVMVCPGSKWINKQLPLSVLQPFLLKMEKDLQCSFILISGTDQEKEICMAIHQSFLHCSIVVHCIHLLLWQNLMCASDLVIAVDSSALHLCGTTSTPSFSVFGPTMPEIFKPLGSIHFAIQGKCPYGKLFEKQCPILRSCPDGGCIRQFSSDGLYEKFSFWWQTLNRSV